MRRPPFPIRPRACPTCGHDVPEPLWHECPVLVAKAVAQAKLDRDRARLFGIQMTTREGA